VLLAGIMSGSCVVPMKYATKWRWESVWMVSMVWLGSDSTGRCGAHNAAAGRLIGRPRNRVDSSGLLGSDGALARLDAE